MMNKKAIAAIIVVIALGVFISGCIGQSDTASTDIKTEQQAAQAVSNISKDVQDVSTVLNEIDSTLSS
ncbi:MAG: hypothetical protein V1870_00035 [Candidatus Aenigmatarchaeota archaeon]